MIFVVVGYIIVTKLKAVKKKYRYQGDWQKAMNKETGKKNYAFTLSFKALDRNLLLFYVLCLFGSDWPPKAKAKPEKLSYY